MCIYMLSGLSSRSIIPLALQRKLYSSQFNVHLEIEMHLEMSLFDRILR